MSAERFHGNAIAEKELGFAQAVKSSDNKLYVSGMVSLDENFEVAHPDDMPAQINHVYESIRTFLGQFGLGMNDIIKETIFSTDMDALMAHIGERRRFFDADLVPAASWIGVSRLVLPSLMIEVEFIAQCS